MEESKIRVIEIGKEFREFGKIGSGGQGEVLKVEKDNKLYALKILKENNKFPIMKEVDIIKKLPRHDHIIRFYDVFLTSKNELIIQMEFARYGNLGEAI